MKKIDLITSTSPLISCLCVTWKKPRMLNRVINCFLDQTYENKQLVIIYEDFDELTSNFMAKIPENYQIKPVKISSYPKKTLGELRNISIQAADGEFVCQWDDDDWFDPDRLDQQMKAIKQTGKLASILTRWIVFNALTHKSYLSNSRLWEGSVLCRKDIIQKYPYPKLPKGEDSQVIHNLFINDHIAFIQNAPELYVYIYHGNNTWEEQHFRQIFQMSSELSEEYNKQVQKLLKF